MKPKPKHKTKRDLFRVDFVTAYTVEECRDHLKAKALIDSDYVLSANAGEHGPFTVERRIEWGFPPGPGFASTIQFHGDLDPTDYGTHVHGAITRETLARLNLSKWLLWIVTGVTLLLAIITFEEPLDLMCGVWLIFAVSWVLLFSYWYIVYTRTIALTDWIRDRLHVLPPDDTE